MTVYCVYYSHEHPPPLLQPRFPPLPGPPSPILPSLILSNLALLQCQVVVMVCLVAVLVGVITDGPDLLKLCYSLVILSSSMLTPSICSAVLGVIMAAIIIGKSVMMDL